MNVLIIPSWYPRPDDKINGSFFQEQAKLVTDCFDVRVLFFRFVARPPFRSFLKKPINTGIEWLKFFFHRNIRVSLPDEEVFTNPSLIEYRASIIGWTLRQLHEKRLSAYMAALDEMISAGWHPDLIHAHSVNIGGLVATRIKDVYGIPYVITEHMPFAICNYPIYIRNDIKRAFANADKVLSLGYDKVRQLGMSDIDVEPNLIFNFVDESVFNMLCTPYEAGQPLKLITIGAASHMKDHRTMLRAVRLLKDRDVPFSLTLIGLKAWGGSGLYNQTLTLIRDLGLDSEITVIDRIERSEVSANLTAHNIFLMTSIAEGFPVSVLEALASGLFVIATRHGGTEDILTEEMGRVVEIKNSEKIADLLKDIYMGRITFNPEKIREAVVAICGREAFRQRLICYYEQALGVTA